MAAALNQEREQAREQARELYEAYLALRYNPCWQWLIAEIVRCRDYAARRIIAAEDWADFCQWRGRLESLSTLLERVDDIEKGKDEDNEF